MPQKCWCSAETCQWDVLEQIPVVPKPSNIFGLALGSAAHLATCFPVKVQEGIPGQLEIVFSFTENPTPQPSPSCSWSQGNNLFIFPPHRPSPHPPFVSFEFNQLGDSVLNIKPLPASSACGSFPGADISRASDFLMKYQGMRCPLQGVLAIPADFLGAAGLPALSCP